MASKPYTYKIQNQFWTWSKGGPMKRNSKTAGHTFMNLGTANATINGLPLPGLTAAQIAANIQIGGQLVFGYNIGTIDRTQYELSFISSGTQNVAQIQAEYLDISDNIDG